jgi:hypothetical protein
MALTCDKGSFPTTVMLFDPKNAPNIAQKMMKAVLLLLNLPIMLVYLNDIIVAPRRWADHVADVTKVLER